jgi:transcriptional regulator with GAF, ATPase, and Fis domain
VEYLPAKVGDLDGDGRPKLQGRISQIPPRLWVALFSVLVVVYGVAVIWHVATTGDIGLRCVFGVRIREVAPYSWSAQPLGVAKQLRGAADPAVTFPGEAPRAGDTLEMVGGRVIRHYTDYVKALRDVRHRTGEAIEVRWRDARTGARHSGHVVIRKPPVASYAWSLVWFLQEMCIFAIGARVFWIRPRDNSARLFFWLCVVTVLAFVSGYHWSRIVDEAPLIFTFAASAVFVPIVSLHFYLVFPRTNPIWERHRSWLRLVIYGMPLLTLAALWSLMVWSRWSNDPVHVETALAALRVVSLGYVALAFAVFVLCLVCLIHSYQAAETREERNQVQWILLATVLALVPIVWLLCDVSVDPSRLGLTRSAWPMLIVSLLYTVAYALSITRYKLLQAEALWNRSVVYLVVSIAAGIVYSGGLVIGALMFGERLISPQISLGTIVACATAVVLLFLLEAARYRFQAALERRFHRDKYKFDLAMRKMSVAVGNLVDRGTLSRRLLEAAAEVLRVEWGSVYLGSAEREGFRLVESWGPPADCFQIAYNDPLVQTLAREPNPYRAAPGMEPVAASDPTADALISLGGEVAVPLVTDGALVGLLILGPKRSGLPFEDEEIAFLGALGSLAAVALHSAEIQRTLESLNHELRDKVEKIAEQQRRILVLQDQLTGRSFLTAPAGEPGDLAEASIEPGADPFGAIKGTSGAIRRLIGVARKVATSPSAVLIRGESGTGKELVAEAIHRASPRSEKPFVKVHCAALSQSLLESELFGHVKGAFTGADRDRVGRFQQADGGTLFLDEIGDINWEVQTKLLRVLQEMSFERVGSSQPISVDVRILAATHQDLEALIRTGKFREDLYYRLNVISIAMPALRDRREDIFELAVHFLSQDARRISKPVTHLDEGAIEALMSYDWPGNIRELENVIERGVVLAEGSAVTVEELPPEIRSPGRRRRARRASYSGIAATVAGVADLGRSGWLKEGLDDPFSPAFDDEDIALERQRLVAALEQARGVKTDAARLLGLPRSTFFSKLKRHGLA